MNTIVQLTNSEYDSLVEKANLSEKEINERAELLYKEKGVIEISVNVQVNDEPTENIRVKPFAYVYDWKSFPVKDEDKDRIVDFMKNYVAGYIKKRFSYRLFLANKHQAMVAKKDLIMKICIIIMTTAACLASSAFAIALIYASAT